MTERFANQAVTTLSAAIATAAATSCTVTDATAFPTTGNFRIKIDGELLLVTRVSGTTFTVTRGIEGTTPATHASGAGVIHLLTKGSLEARVANRFISDMYANKPAAGIKGRLFIPTDGLYLEYDDGTTWHKYGPCQRLKAPPQTGWTWFNQGNAAVTYAGGVLILSDPDQDTNNPQVRGVVRPLGEGKTTLTTAFTMSGVTSAQWYGGNCIHGGGTEADEFTLWGLKMTTSYPYPYLSFAPFTSPTVAGTAPSFDSRILWPHRLFWFRFKLDGEYKRYYFSEDGLHWTLWYSVASYTDHCPMQYGVALDRYNNATAISLALVHWEES